MADVRATIASKDHGRDALDDVGAETVRFEWREGAMLERSRR